MIAKLGKGYIYGNHELDVSPFMDNMQGYHQEQLLVVSDSAHIGFVHANTEILGGLRALLHLLALV